MTGNENDASFGGPPGVELQIGSPVSLSKVKKRSRVGTCSPQLEVGECTITRSPSTSGAGVLPFGYVLRPYSASSERCQRRCPAAVNPLSSPAVDRW